MTGLFSLGLEKQQVGSVKLDSTLALGPVGQYNVWCQVMKEVLFSEISTGHWAVLQLPCCPSKQGELSENI